jgi:CheY-like chemotaxis protein
VKTNGAQNGNNETILLVEDETPLRRLARKLLERSGYTVFEAGSGQEALTVWETNRDAIQLVITDMIMPGGMSGRELAVQLREKSPELPMIFTSGYTTELAGNLLEREQIEFLAKPYSPQQLTQLVQDTLRNRRG